MKYFPIMLDLKNKNVLIVGGGKIALRKTRELIRCSKNIKVVAKSFVKGFENLGVKLIKREFRPSDLKDVFLVFGCADRATNEFVYKHIKHHLYNAVDQPDISNFISPAIVKKGKIIISISTQGYSPYLAKALRIVLQKKLKEVTKLADLLYHMRDFLRKFSLRKRRMILKEFVESRGFYE